MNGSKRSARTKRFVPPPTRLRHVWALDPLTVAVRPAHASELIGVSEEYLRELRRRGLGPRFIRINHSILLYPLHSLRAWAEEQSIDPAFYAADCRERRRKRPIDPIEAKWNKERPHNPHGGYVRGARKSDMPLEDHTDNPRTAA